MSQAETAGPNLPSRIFVRPFTPRPRPDSVAEFYHQLAVMLRAGMTAGRAFGALEEQCSSGLIRRRLPTMRRHIEEGGSVGGAFAQFPHVFDPVHVAMIRAGEFGGRLDSVLDSLSAMSRRRANLTKLFITGVIYPVFLLHFAFLAVPFIERLRGAETPYWKLALPKILIFYAVLFVLFAVPRVLRQFRLTAWLVDGLRRLVPVWSGVTRKLALARFVRTLDGLYTSGVTLLDALPVAADTCGDEVLRRRALRLAPQVEAGTPLSQAMRTAGGFPAMMTNMLATGEEGGELSRMLANVAEYYEGEAETALRRLVVILPVVIYLGVAAYVGYQIVKTYAAMLNQRLGGM